MAKQSKQAGVADPATQAQFVSLATITLQTNYQPLLGEHDLTPVDRLDRTMLLASLAQEIQDVAQRIPPGMSAVDALRDFMAYATDAGRHWDDPPARPIPARWMGLAENQDVQALFSGTQEEVDGRWQAVNQEWKGLPFPDSTSLRVMAHIRSIGSATFEDLIGLPVCVGSEDVARLLDDAANAGWVERSEEMGISVWRAIPRLELTLQCNPDDADLDNPETLQRGKLLEWSVGKTKRMAGLAEQPDSRAVLSHLRLRGRARTKDFQQAVPHLDRYAVARLLRALEEAGWVQNVSKDRNAVWTGTKRFDETLAGGRNLESVIASPALRPIKTKAEALKRIVELAGERPGVTPAWLLQALPEFDRYAIRRMVDTLCRRGDIYRLGHRVYSEAYGGRALETSRDPSKERAPRKSIGLASSVPNLSRLFVDHLESRQLGAFNELTNAFPDVSPTQIQAWLEDLKQDGLVRLSRYRGSIRRWSWLNVN